MEVWEGVEVVGGARQLEAAGRLGTDAAGRQDVPRLSANPGPGGRRERLTPELRALNNCSARLHERWARQLRERVAAQPAHFARRLAELRGSNLGQSPRIIT